MTNTNLGREIGFQGKRIAPQQNTMIYVVWDLTARTKIELWLTFQNEFNHYYPLPSADLWWYISETCNMTSWAAVKSWQELTFDTLIVYNSKGDDFSCVTRTRNHLTPHIRVTVENTGGNSVTRLFDIIWSCLILSTDYVLCCTAPSYTMVIVDSILNGIKLKIDSVTISHWMVCYLVCRLNGRYALDLS